jgi:hypothetical protein
VVRASIRLWSPYRGFAYVPDLAHLAVPGGPIVGWAPPADMSLDIMQVAGFMASGQSTVWMGPLLKLELAIPATDSPELIFSTPSMNDAASRGLSPPTAGVLIDDLRVE